LLPNLQQEVPSFYSKGDIYALSEWMNVEVLPDDQSDDCFDDAMVIWLEERSSSSG
jgi:hypothetical protein